MGGKGNEAIFGIFMTVFLGLYFTFLQVQEYGERTFSFADSLYGSIFFIATGFHGLHVLIGSIILLVRLKRLLSFQRTTSHLVGFEIAGWYWHFVDVVWLFLFCCIY